VNERQCNIDAREEGAMHFPIFNLDDPAHYWHAGWFSISIANAVIVIGGLVLFAMALLLPFPGSKGAEL
jgi:hypothetical protein